MTSRNGVPPGKLITQETVRCCTPEIISYTNLRHLVPFLYAAKLLTDAEFAELLNEKQPEHEKTLRLLAILKTKGPDWPQQFATCLEKAADHRGHACILKVLEQHGAGGKPTTTHPMYRLRGVAWYCVLVRVIPLIFTSAMPREINSPPHTCMDPL